MGLFDALRSSRSQEPEPPAEVQSLGGEVPLEASTSASELLSNHEVCSISMVGCSTNIILFIVN